jgi:predicted permease
MQWLGELGRRVWMLLRRRQFDADLEEEMRLHVDLRAQQKAQAGLSQEDARHAAARRFGNPTMVKERSHNSWGWQRLEYFMQDIGYGLRAMGRTKGITIVALLSLALGIGANTAIFSLLDAVMLRSLPVEEPQRLVLFGKGRWVGSIDGLPNRSWQLFSYPFYREISKKNEVFSGVTAIDSIEFAAQGTVSGGGREMMHCDLVSGTYFSVLGLRPALGRLLTDADDQAPGSGPVAVISYAWWNQRFGSDPSVIGKAVQFGTHEYTIVGVAPQEFFGTAVGQAPDFWIPLSMEKEVSPGWNGLDDKFFQSLYLIARLKPGVTNEQATANVNLLFKQILRSEYVGPQPSQKALTSIEHAQIELTSVARGLSQLRARFSLPLQILMTIVVLVLLIACANIANLLLARGTVRAREIAVRMAIGASRSRMVLQLLTESFLLAVLGAALGVALAWKAGELLLRMATDPQQPATVAVTPNLRVLLFTLLLTCVTTLLSGMVPALRATRLNLTSSLKEGRGTTSAASRISLARMLVVSQIAVSLILLVAAGLFVRSLVKLTNVDTGFDKQNVLVFQLDEYAAGFDQDARLEALLRQIEERVQAVPGVHAASFSMFTFNQGEWSSDVILQGIPRTPENSHEVLNNMVGPGFFATMGLPVIAGRAFTAHDNASAQKVAVINETMAQKYFPRVSAVGRRFGFGDDPAHSGDVEIIGVVKNAKYVALEEEPQAAAYFTYMQHPQYLSNFVVRYSGDSRQMTSAVRHAIAEVNANVPINGIATLAEQVDESTANQRLIAQLSSFFGLLAGLLVCIGIYGLMSYAVARRTNEIGVRMALGAGRSNVLWMVMREILILTSVGLAIGVPLALAGIRLVSRMLYGLSPWDPVSLIAAVCLLVGIGVLAGYLPARRASLVDPTVALRYE